jgi:PAS domain S-box-containing protein
VSQPIKVLIVEDREDDALLLGIQLQRAGYEPTCRRVETREAMEAALKSQHWDVVVADYLLPRLNGLEALAVVKAHGLDMPFIIVSGAISEDTAVATMKAGAHDYVMKDNLARLGPAVQRELREAEVRRARRRADEVLKVEQVFRQAIENSVPAGITAVDLEGRQTYVNRAFCAMVGWSESELVGALPPFRYWPPEHISSITGAMAAAIEGSAPAGGLELRFRRQSDDLIDVLLQITPLKDAFGTITGWVSSVSDITERKRAEVRLAAEHAITRLLANVQSLDHAAPGILGVLLESLEVDLGGFWVPAADASVVRLQLMEPRMASAAWQAFIETGRRLSLRPGDSLPGRVWQERRPMWVTNLASEAGFERRNAAMSAGLRSAVAFPIQSGGVFFGVLEFYAQRRMEPDSALANMMTAIGSEIGQFIHRRSAEEALRRAHDELETRVQHRTSELKSANARLHTAIAERRRLENELLEITEKERRRLALDLHDDLGQRLSGIALMTKGLELKLARQENVQAREAARIYNLVQDAMSHASDLAHDLATLDLAEKDLPAALSDLADHARELFGISCRFTAEGSASSLEPNVVMQLYKIVQEAVTNAIKHGKAKRVGINLTNGAEQLVLRIQNNGLPFPDLSGHSTGMGLRIMNYRANLIGATLEIKSAGSRGTLVTCRVPLEAKK